LGSKNIADLNQLLIKVERMDPDIKLMFVDSLIKYVHALDTVDWPDAFLTLWLVLENLSLSSLSARLKMDEVCSRIKNLLGLSDVLHKELVDAVVETRNTYVHLGKFSKDGFMEVQYLKIIVEWALSNFYTLLDRFADKKSWEEYFSLISLNPSILEKKRKTVDSVIKLKQDAQEFMKNAKKPRTLNDLS
jgi:hypothetical protein